MSEASALEAHEAARFFPMHGKDGFAALRQSISTAGWDAGHPIVLCDGKILDGRNRYQACVELGVTPTFVEYAGNPFAKVWLENGARRDIEAGQKTAIRARLNDASETWQRTRAEAHETANRKRSEAAKGQHAVSNPRRGERSGAVSHDTKPDADFARERNRLANEANVSTATAGRVLALKNKRPDLFDGVAGGDITLTKAIKKAQREERQEQLARQWADQPQAVATIEVIEGDALQVLPTLEQRFSLLVADPPYNVKDVEWDKIGTRYEYVEFMRTWITSARKCLNKDHHAFVFCSPIYMADVEMLLRELGWSIQSRVIWHHRNLSMGRAPETRLISSWEPIFHMGSYPLNFPEEWGSERFDVREHAVPQTNFTDAKVHQTQKPLELIRWLVEIGSFPGQWVLDPFGGGGTTAAACKELERPCVSIERDAAFADIIRKRVNA